MKTDDFLSDLPEDELAKYLKEIELEDDDESDDMGLFYKPTNKPEKEKIYYVGPNKAATETAEERALRMRRQRAENIADKRQRVREIKREYVMKGEVIKLSEPLDKEVIKLTIERLTDVYYDKANKAKSMLTTYIEKELRRYVPQTLKVLYRTNKEAFAPHPGFEYVTSAVYGSLRLLIKPDIPNVYTNPNEMQVLKARCKHRLNTFDKLVERYHWMTKKRVQEETNLAVRFRRMKSLLELLETSLNFYEVYMDCKHELQK